MPWFFPMQNVPGMTGTSTTSGNQNQPNRGSSSNPMDEIEDPSLFPLVWEWLDKLDQSPLAQDGHNFVHFALNFQQKGFIQISQLTKETLTIDRWTAIIPRMVEGTAGLIIDIATKEVEKIRHRSRKSRKAKY
jgi:hypothetical protein